jgi:hypothetical protein
MLCRFIGFFAFALFTFAAPPQTPAASAQSQPVPSIDRPVPEGPTATLSTKTERTEDWTTLALDKSGLPLSSDRGPVLSHVEQPEFTRELVRLQWRAHDPIEVYVVRPHGIANPPVILYLYNYNSDVDRFRDDGWCQRATKDGFAAVGFVSALAPQRFHTPRPLKQWFVSELQEALATSTHDVQMILNYLTTRGDLDMNHVGMFGQASGGAVALLAASVDPRLIAVDVMDPWGDWPEWLKGSPQIPEAERPAYLTPEFLGKVANLDPVLVLPHLKGKALRIQQLLDDPLTPIAAMDKIRSAAPAGDVVRYKDWREHQAAMSGVGLSGWLRAQLSQQSRNRVSQP